MPSERTNVEDEQYIIHCFVGRRVEAEGGPIDLSELNPFMLGQIRLNGFVIAPIEQVLSWGIEDEGIRKELEGLFEMAQLSQLADPKLRGPLPPMHGE